MAKREKTVTRSRPIRDEPPGWGLRIVVGFWVLVFVGILIGGWVMLRITSKGPDLRRFAEDRNASERPLPPWEPTPVENDKAAGDSLPPLEGANGSSRPDVDAGG